MTRPGSSHWNRRATAITSSSDGVVRAAVERYVDLQIAAITRRFMRHAFAGDLCELLDA